MGLVRALEFLVPTMLLMLGNQVMYQKFFSAKSEKDARISVVGWIIGTVILETLIVAIAVFGRALYPTGEVALHPHEIIPYTARHGLPAVLGALLLGAVFAKVISTASNYLFSPATNLVNDVFVRYIAPDASNKRVLIISRLAVVLLGCWALYQAVYAESILQKMLWAYTIYSAALTPVVLAAFYSKRVTAWGAVAAIAGGTVVTLAWDLPGSQRRSSRTSSPIATPFSPRSSLPSPRLSSSACSPRRQRRPSSRNSPNNESASSISRGCRTHRWPRLSWINWIT